MTKFCYGEFCRIKILRIRPEAHAGTGITPAAGIDNVEVFGSVAIGEGNKVNLTVATDGNFHPVRQRVNHRDPHTVQTTGVLVVFIGELTTSMELGHDQLNPGDLFFRMNIHRHTTTVIHHFQGLVFMQYHFDIRGVPRQRFIHTVVDHFLTKVIRAGRVCVHSRAPFNRLQTI